MTRFVISDIHGAYKALIQCFERSGFDKSQDLLICLGDVCDGYPEVDKCFDELLSVKNLVYLIGNHDEWCLKWAINGDVPEGWMSQGGYSTIKCYNESFDKDHLALLKNSKYYHIIDNTVFVHGGFNIGQPLEKQSNETLVWDRSLVYETYANNENIKSLSGFDRVFVGHTPTIKFNSLAPVQFCEVIMTDTGAGWGQRLSIINIDSGKFFQSDPTMELYPIKPGR